jgi:methionyl-tRNA synthetase
VAARIFGGVPNQQDVLRYALTSNAPETKDNDFTWKDFQARNNNDWLRFTGISLTVLWF